MDDRKVDCTLGSYAPADRTKPAHPLSQPQVHSVPGASRSNMSHVGPAPASARRCQLSEPDRSPGSRSHRQRAPGGPELSRERNCLSVMTAVNGSELPSSILMSPVAATSPVFLSGKATVLRLGLIARAIRRHDTKVLGLSDF